MCVLYVFAKHHWIHCTFLMQNTPGVLKLFVPSMHSGLDGGIFSDVLEHLWTCVSDFVLINHSMHFTFSYGFMSSELIINTVGQNLSCLCNNWHLCCSVQQTPTRNAVEQISSCHFNTWCWHAAPYMDRTRISLGHFKCDEWCPRWMFVMFRTNSESFSHRWYTKSESVFFHTVLFTRKIVKIILYTPHINLI
jgi:hypothetical protein